MSLIELVKASTYKPKREIAESAYHIEFYVPRRPSIMPTPEAIDHFISKHPDGVCSILDFNLQMLVKRDLDEQGVQGGESKELLKVIDKHACLGNQYCLDFLVECYQLILSGDYYDLMRLARVEAALKYAALYEAHFKKPHRLGSFTWLVALKDIFIRLGSGYEKSLESTIRALSARARFMVGEMRANRQYVNCSYISASEICEHHGVNFDFPYANIFSNRILNTVTNYMLQKTEYLSVGGMYEDILCIDSKYYDGTQLGFMQFASSEDLEYINDPLHPREEEREEITNSLIGYCKFSHGKNLYNIPTWNLCWWVYDHFYDEDFVFELLKRACDEFRFAMEDCHPNGYFLTATVDEFDIVSLGAARRLFGCSEIIYVPEKYRCEHVFQLLIQG